MHAGLAPGLEKFVVSILVFVELALDDECTTSQDENIRVSILVFVELALDESVRIVGVGSVTVFQSLFSWNLLLMLGRLWSGFRNSICFNPCFRGTCS